MPPTNAAMNPLPPSVTASAYPVSAEAMVNSWTHWPWSQPLPSDHRNSRPARTPTPTPPTSPQPICEAALWNTADGTPRSSVASEMSRATRKNGTASPSLSPLSTSSACRTRAGTAGSSTTRWPSAASVEQSIVDSRNAPANPIPGKISRPAPIPSSMVSGNPISNNRPGQATWLRSARRSIRAESLNSRSTRASSVTRCATSLSAPAPNQPAPPTTRPAVMNTIADVTPRRSSRADVAAYAIRTTPTVSSVPTIASITTPAPAHLTRHE